MQTEFVILGQGAVESGYLLSMQETSQQQNIVNGVQQGGVIVEASTFNETTELGHWYGFLEAEKDNYFREKYNSRGSISQAPIAGLMATAEMLMRKSSEVEGLKC